VGTEKKAGDTANLEQFKELNLRLKEEKNKRKIKISRYSNVKEWLGTEGGIKKLIRSHGGLPVNKIYLAKCKGTIKSPNTNQDRGYIELQTIRNHQLTSQIDTYFSFRQQKKDMQLYGKQYSMKKVCFFVCFTLDNGLEARDVELDE
jgi:hypothetical protein